MAFKCAINLKTARPRCHQRRNGLGPYIRSTRSNRSAMAPESIFDKHIYTSCASVASLHTEDMKKEKKTRDWHACERNNVSWMRYHSLVVLCRQVASFPSVPYWLSVWPGVRLHPLHDWHCLGYLPGIAVYIVFFNILTMAVSRIKRKVWKTGRQRS